MIDLLSTSQNLLKDAGFSVRLLSIGRSPVLCFEDSALIGFCCSFDTADDMLNRWKLFETEILTRFAPSFRAAGDKAWNVYCAFLCGSTATPEQKRKVSWIEEGLERTRKIAACGISSREELTRALLPVLPIQYQPVLLDADVTERLKKRIEDISPQVVHIALDPAVSAEEVVRLLGERS